MACFPANKRKAPTMRKRIDYSGLPSCFEAFDRLEARSQQDQNRQKKRGLPAQIVLLESGLSARAWFESLGEPCSTPELQIDDGQLLQLSVSESAVYVLVSMALAQDLAVFAVHPLHRWLIHRRRHHQVAALHIVLALNTALFARTDQTSQRPSTASNGAWLGVYKRSLGLLRAQHNRQAPVVVHLCMQRIPSLLQPELMLSGRQLSGSTARASWQQWREHALHAQDTAPDPLLGFKQTHVLLDRHVCEAAFIAFCKALRTSVRHARGVQPALLLVHTVGGALSAPARDALVAIAHQRTSWASQWPTALVWLGVLLLTAVAYTASCAWRSEVLNQTAGHLDNLSQQLDRSGCEDVSHLNLAAALLNQTPAHTPRMLMATQAFYPHQHRQQDQALQFARHSTTRWTLRCLLKPADAALTADLIEYLQLLGNHRGTAATHEEAYLTLKAVLMLRQSGYLDRTFLLPRIKARLLSLHTGKGLLLDTTPSQQAADRLLETLLSDVTAWADSWPPPMHDTITAVRSALRSTRQDLEPIQGVLRPLLDRVNGSAVALSPLSLLGDPVQNWFAADSLIPAAYAPDAYATQIHAHIGIQLSQPKTHYDWVLDLHGSPDPAPHQQQSLHSITRQYWQQHRDIWLQSLESIRPLRVLTPETSRAMLAAFSNQAKDPIFAMVQVLQQSGQPAFQDLALQMGMPQATVTSSSQSGKTDDIWPTYRSLLQILAQMQASPGLSEEDNRLFLVRQVLDPASHLNRLSDWIVLQTQSIKDERLRAALRRFMRMPIQAWATEQSRSSARSLNKLWQAEALVHLKSLTGRFPFNPSGIDASPEEIGEFLQQGNGALTQFRQRYLQATADSLPLQGRQKLFVPLALDPDFDSLLSRLKGLRQAQTTPDSLSSFELTAQPNPALSEQSIRLDQQAMRYRNGPQIPQVFTWQAQNPSLSIQISGLTQNGLVCQGITFSGRMAWIRALKAAQISRRGHDWLLSWTPCQDKTIAVSFLYRHLNGLTPSDIGFLESWPIPLAIFKEIPE
jgi:type VI protein secretion system component VasK